MRSLGRFLLRVIGFTATLILATREWAKRAVSSKRFDVLLTIVIEVSLGTLRYTFGEDVVFVLLLWGGVIVTTLITRVLPMLWKLVVNILLIGLASTLCFYPPLRDWQEDWRHSFAATDERTINILLSDFGSNPPEPGREFTEQLYEDLLNETTNYEINGIRYDLPIVVKRTKKTWTEEEILKRGEGRGADLGIIGTYKRGNDLDSVITHRVEKLQCFILDSSLATVLEYRDPVDALYDLSVISRDREIPVLMVTKVSKPIQYISRLAINLQLLRMAYREKDDLQRRKILIAVNDNFAEIADLLGQGSRAFASFHQGNSRFRNAKLSAREVQAGIYEIAATNYRESIAAYQANPGMTVIKYDPVKPYFNLAATFRQLNILTKENVWLDSAEVTYQQAEKNWPSQTTTQELCNFLEDRLETEFILRNITTKEFGERVEKYVRVSHSLGGHIEQGNAPHNKKQSVLSVLKEKRQRWERRRQFYQPR